MAINRLLKNKASAAGKHWAVRYCVLGRTNSAAIRASCVLRSQVPIAPQRRSIVLEQPLFEGTLWY